MNRQKGHIKYRKSVYKKNRIKLVVLSAVITLVLVSLIFLIIGNVLGNKVENGSETDTTDLNSETVSAHKDIASIYAYPVPLDMSGSTLQGRISSARANGYKAASFYLDDKDGSLWYSSPTAQSLGKQQSNTELRTLQSIVSIFSDSEFYTVGVTHIADFEREDDLERSAAIGYYAALIAEALRSGIDEVLVYVGEIPLEQYTELVRLCQEVRRLCPDKGAIGISLPPSFFTQQQPELIFDLLWQEYDYVAIDLTSPTNEMSLSEYADKSLVGNTLYYLLRYNIRVLLPNTDTASLSEAEAAVHGKGSQNIQILS